MLLEGKKKIGRGMGHVDWEHSLVANPECCLRVNWDPLVCLSLEGEWRVNGRMGSMFLIEYRYLIEDNTMHYERIVESDVLMASLTVMSRVFGSRLQISVFSKFCERYRRHHRLGD